MSNAITDKPEGQGRPEEGAAPAAWRPFREFAPSVIQEEQPLGPRVVGALGVFFFGLGGISILFMLGGAQTLLTRTLLGPGRASFLVVLGLIGMLFHAASDKDQQVRRLYGAFGFLLLLVGIALPLLPIGGQPIGGQLLPGALFLFTALLFQLAFLRNESEANTRDVALRVLGFVGAALAVVAFGWSNVRSEFLLPGGLVLALLGLAYLWAFVSVRGTNDEIGYRVAQGIGILGLAVFVVALARTALPPLLYSWGWLKPPAPSPYLVPTGVLLMGLGLLYWGLSLGLTSENKLIVLTQRELAAFFFSPVAYFVLIGLTIAAYAQFWSFLWDVIDPRGQPLIEPIVHQYVVSLIPVLCAIAAVPALTMRLLSEEKRTGSMEVMLTAPVDETSVVLGKFLGTLIFFSIIWLPWALFLLALRIEGGTPFDYRPLLSFFIALVFTGASLISMGLFFSSLTRNQIISFVLTLVFALILVIGTYLAKLLVGRGSPDSAWATMLNHISVIDLWSQTLQGKLVPRYLLFHASLAGLFLFLTVKVLEARRWT